MRVNHDLICNAAENIKMRMNSEKKETQLEIDRECRRRETKITYN